MIIWTPWISRTLGLVLFAAAVLPARTAVAQIFGSDPESLKRTDALIKKAEELVEETSSARKQLGKTVDIYSSIYAEDAADVRGAYKDVDKEITKTEKQREEVKKKLEELKLQADTYFAGWSDSLHQIGDTDLRKRSERRMTETRGQFDGILESVRTAREAYEPFMTSLKDQWTYLGHDLNPNGIASLKSDADELNQRADELFKMLDESMKKANDYIDSLRSSRPIS